MINATAADDARASGRRHLRCLTLLPRSAATPTPAGRSAFGLSRLILFNDLCDVRLDPQATADSQIRHRIFVRREFAKKRSANRIHRGILSAENPPKIIQRFQ